MRFQPDYNYSFTSFERPLQTTIVGCRWQPDRCTRTRPHPPVTGLCFSAAFAFCLCHRFNFLCTTMGYHEGRLERTIKSLCFCLPRFHVAANGWDRMSGNAAENSGVWASLSSSSHGVPGAFHHFAFLCLLNAAGLGCRYCCRWKDDAID